MTSAVGAISWRMTRPRLLPTSPSIKSTSGMPSSSVRGSAAQMPAATARKRPRAFAFLEVGARERAAHGGSDGIGSDVAVGREVARQHRQVLQRQLVGIGDQDGVAADLNRKLRGADDGRANALARVPDRSEVAPMRQEMAQLLGEVGAEIAEAPSFPLV